MRDQRVADQQHLQLLCIFHFVVAGLAVLGMAFLFIHYMMFSTFFANPHMWEQAQQQAQQHGQPAPPFNPADFFKAFIWFYLFFGIIALLAAVGNIISGLFLRKRKNRMFSLVIAGLDCLQVPFGTVLGVFTIIVLVRPSVAELYDSNPPS
jgi:hypothetical protein